MPLSAIKCGNFWKVWLEIEPFALKLGQEPFLGKVMKPSKFKISTLSMDELWALHEEVGNLLSEKLADEKRQLEERLAKLNSGMMAKINRPDPQVPERRKVRRKYPPVLPKFQNPSDPSETWAGRGKQPRWLVSQLKAGKKMNDFLIDRAKRKRASTR
jgi:DNA-binding protein H-NS